MVTRSLVVSILSGALVCAGSAQAATVLLDVPFARDGAESAGTNVANAALGTEFRTSDAVSNFEVTFALDCFSSCAGELVLVADRPGPSVPIRAFQGRRFFDFQGTGRNTITAFFGFDLIADTSYALVVAVTSGNAIWFQTDPAKKTENGITDGQDFYSTSLNPQASYRSDFVFEPQTDAAFNIRMTGDITSTPQQPTTIPLPASGWLLGAALLAAGAGARRRRMTIRNH